MNFLTAAIPGLREVRAPLVAGYIWLIFVWLIVDPQLPLTQHSTGALHSVAELAATAGPVATAAAVSVAAYLIGAISIGVMSWLRQRYTDWLIAAATPPPYDQPPAAADRSADGARVKVFVTSLPRSSPRIGAPPFLLRRAEFLRPLPETPVSWNVDRIAARLQGEPADPGEFHNLREELFDSSSEVSDLLPHVQGADSLHESFLKHARPLREDKRDLSEALEVQRRALAAIRGYEEELALPATLIVGGAPLAFAETDRLRSEGQFRLAVCPPLLAVICVLVLQGGASLLWLLALVGPVVLANQGLANLRESQKMIRATLEHGDAKSPAMEGFRAYLEQLDRTERNARNIDEPAANPVTADLG